MGGSAGIAEHGKDFIRTTWFTKVLGDQTTFGTSSHFAGIVIASITTDF
jgi:hypothetical protein